MEIGLGHWEMSAAAFWSLTLNEYTARLDGWMEKHSIDQQPDMTRARLEELKRRYPD